MTKDSQFKTLLDIHRRTIEVMDSVQSTMKQINDEHKNYNRELNRNTEKLGEMVASNKQFIKLVSFILTVLVFAVVALAGAEKVLTFFRL